MPGFVPTTYIPPPFGNARCSSIAAFTGASTGTVYLGVADYELGYIYVFDGSTGNFITVQQPNFPALFGSWAYTAYDQFAPAGSTWINNDAYSGEYSLSITSISSGVLAEFPDNVLEYNVVGTELFTLNVKLTKTLPDQILVTVYDSNTSSWNMVWWGTPVNNFPSLTGTYLGPIPAIFNQWIGLPITVTNLNVLPDDILTQVGFGEWKSSGICTVIFSDFSSNLETYAAQNSYNWLCNGGPGNIVNDTLACFSKNLYQTDVAYNPLQIISQKINFNSTTTSLCGATYIPNLSLPLGTPFGPYVIGNDGIVYWSDGSPSPFIWNASPPYATTPYGLVNDGTENLYTLFPNSSGIGQLNVVSKTWTTFASPFNELSAIAYSSGVVIGGGNLISLTQNISGIAYSPLTQQLLISDYIDNEIAVYNYTLGGWSLAQIVSGIPGPSFIHVALNNPSEALVISSSGLYALSAIGPAWVSSVVSGVTDVNSVDILNGSGTQALVAQPSLNQVTILNQAGTSWTSGQVLTLDNPTQVAVLGNNVGALVASSSGITQLINENLDGIWTIGQTIPFFNVIKFLTDQENLNNPYTYMIQNSVGGVSVTAFTSGLINTNSYTVSGTTFDGGIVVNYQVFINTLNGHINAGTIIGNLTQQSDLGSIGISTSGVSTVWVGNPTDFINLVLMGAGNSILEYYNSKSLLLSRTYDSLVAISSGVSGWNTIDLVNRNAIAAIASGVSGFTYAITTDNQLYQFSSTSLSSGWPKALQVPTDQENGIPIGVSDLIWYNNQLYASSSLYGGLISMNPSASG